MENKFTDEMIAKAKETKNVEELNALAKEAGITLTTDDLVKAYEDTHPKTGELNDDELDNVAGGCPDDDGNKCPDCGKPMEFHSEGDQRAPDYNVYYTCSCGYDSRRH